jgi:hypothetical protein
MRRYSVDVAVLHVDTLGEQRIYLSCLLLRDRSPRFTKGKPHHSPERPARRRPERSTESRHDQADGPEQREQRERDPKVAISHRPNQVPHHRLSLIPIQLIEQTPAHHHGGILV